MFPGLFGSFGSDIRYLSSLLRLTTYISLVLGLDWVDVGGLFVYQHAKFECLPALSFLLPVQVAGTIAGYRPPSGPAQP